MVVIFFAFSISVALSLTGCKFFSHEIEQTEGHLERDRKDFSGLDLLLEALQLGREDLGIHRPLPSKDPFLLSKVPLFLDHPLQAVIPTLLKYLEIKDVGVQIGR